MKVFEKEKQSYFNSIFFTVKIIALLFCASPLFLYFFTENSTVQFETMSLQAIVASMVILGVIALVWLVMDRNYRKSTPSTLSTVAEILLFFIICCVSVLLSGGFLSYYKFIFIFIVVVYTIEAGFSYGMVVSALSTAFIMIVDLVGYSDGGVNAFFQADIALGAMSFVVSWILGFYVKTEKEHIQVLKNYANMDALTGLYNHRYFQECLKEKCAAAVENGNVLSVAMIDIDNFNSYNDAHGHEKGDAIVKVIADILTVRFNRSDVICRFGGDKFAVIMPNVAEEDVARTCERLRIYIEDYHFDGQEAMPTGNLTVSVGVSAMQGDDDTHMRVVARADAALQKAKFFRKNSVRLYNPILGAKGRLDIKSRDGMLSVKSLISIINSRDSYTYEHTDRVVWYCKIFAEYMGLDEKDRTNLFYGAFLHDIGKINVSKSALISDSSLTEGEWEEMRCHPADGAEIVHQMDVLEDVVDIVRQHHEKYDGSGYPAGFKGEEINRLARMLTIVDSFDAMTAERPYREAFSYERALDEIRGCKGSHFDPVFADKFIDAINDAINNNLTVEFSNF